MMRMPAILAAALALMIGPALADDPGFTYRDADKVLDACLAEAPIGAHQPHKTCYTMMRARFAELEPDIAGSGPGAILIVGKALEAWERRILRTYSDLITQAAADALTDSVDGYTKRNVTALEAMREAWPTWVETRCTWASARNGGGYDHLDAALCEEYMHAQHWADLMNPDAVLGCFDCRDAKD